MKKQKKATQRAAFFLYRIKDNRIIFLRCRLSHD